MTKHSQKLTPGLSSASSCNCARGFSLIELMIAITLGMLLMTALVSLFVNISRSNMQMASINSQIENGRYAIQFIENDLVHAGFWGGYIPEFDDLTASTTTAPTDLPAAVPAPCAANASWGSDANYVPELLGISVDAYDGVPTRDFSGTPTSCSGVVTNKKDNTDVLVIRHADTCIAGVGSCDAYDSNKLYFQFSRCETEIGSSNKYKLASTGLNLTQRDCTTTADIRRFISDIYYIRDYANTAGDGIPTLMRSQFDESGGTLAHQTAIPLIEGIEAFRVELGIDNVSDSGAAVDYSTGVTWADASNLTSPTNRGDGSPDGDYVHCGSTGCTRDQLVNVVAAKLYVLARADKETPGYTDNKVYTLGNGLTYCSTTSTSSGCTFKVLNPNYKHHAFTTLVRLNNISMRRETP